MERKWKEAEGLSEFERTQPLKQSNEIETAKIARGANLPGELINLQLLTQ